MRKGVSPKKLGSTECRKGTLSQKGITQYCKGVEPILHSVLFRRLQGFCLITIMALSSHKQFKNHWTWTLSSLVMILERTNTQSCVHTHDKYLVPEKCKMLPFSTYLGFWTYLVLVMVCWIFSLNGLLPSTQPKH